MSLNRFAARKDSNQTELVAAFRALGCSVQVISGEAVPDLLVGTGGRNYLVEVKTETGKLRPKQADWHRLWRGQVCIARNTNDVERLVSQWRKAW
jgi:Holliday junction resolvase